jgi:hypothetical protein
MVASSSKNSEVNAFHHKISAWREKFYTFEHQFLLMGFSQHYRSAVDGGQLQRC